MRRNRKALWIGGAAALAAAAVAAWFLLPFAPFGGGGSSDDGGSGGGQGGGAGGARAVVVELAEATRGRAAESFRTVGEIEAEERVELGAEQPGRIREILVEGGARVAADEAILRFDDAAEQADLQSAEAALSEARRALQRARELSEGGFIAEARLDERSAAAEQARARLAAARQALEDTVVRAPLAGELGLLQVSPGDYVSAGQTLVELVTVERLRARFSLPVEVVADLDPGDTVKLYAADGERPVLAAVDVIAPYAGSDSRLVDVETVIAEAVSGMRPGAVVDVEVVTAVREDAVFVPETALQWEGPRAHLYRVDEERVARRVGVEVGVRRAGRVELRGSSVEPGTSVVVEGVQKLRDGARVTTPSGGGESGDESGGASDDGGGAAAAAER